MFVFKDILPTEHYLQHHRDVPWETVCRIILSTKDPRKKGTRYEIEADGHYLLLEVKERIAWVINAKRL
jgi:hypothetical protein